MICKRPAASIELALSDIKPSQLSSFMMLPLEGFSLAIYWNMDVSPSSLRRYVIALATIPFLSIVLSQIEYECVTKP